MKLPQNWGAGEPTAERREVGQGMLEWLARPRAVCLMLAVATLIVFWPVSGFDYVEYDDFVYVKHNAYVWNGLTAEGIAWAFQTGYQANWHPITWISHMLDAQLFGRGPTGPHVTNVLLHMANALLLFLGLRRFTGAHWRSALVAGWFALHPLRVESVAWIAERKDVLSTFFALLTLWFYGEYVRRRRRAELGGPLPADGVGDPGSARILTSGYYWLTLVAFALGLMSKPMLVTLPFALLLLDYWPLGRLPARPLGECLGEWRGLVLEKTPFFLFSLGSSVVTFLVQRRGGAVQMTAEYPLSGRFENVPVAYMRYLGKAIFPWNLCVFYPHPKHWPWVAVAASVAVLAGLCFAVVRWGRRFPFAPVGWFWFLGMLVPVIGLVQVGGQAMADRYSYVPLVGVFIIVAWGAAELARGRPLLVRALAVVGGLSLLACGVGSRHQLQSWRDTDTLIQRALALTDNNPVIAGFMGYHYYDLGNEAREAGHPDLACAWYCKAIQLNGNDSMLHNNLGLALQNLGRFEEAIQEHRTALRLAPGNVNARNNLAVALTQVGKLEEAIEQLAESLKQAPGDPVGHGNLGALLFRKERFREAVEQYKLALQQMPDNPALLGNLADALVRQGNREEAIANYRHALQVNPGDARAKQRLHALGIEAP